MGICKYCGCPYSEYDGNEVCCGSASCIKAYKEEKKEKEKSKKALKEVKELREKYHYRT